MMLNRGRLFPEFIVCCGNPPATHDMSVELHTSITQRHTSNDSLILIMLIPVSSLSTWTLLLSTTAMLD